MHSLFGNREKNEKGMTCLYWNKGSAFLENKQMEIGTLIKTHKPHLFGLGEANLRSDQYLGDAQQPGYTIPALKTLA